jgi:hypothetical protein
MMNKIIENHDYESVIIVDFVGNFLFELNLNVSTKGVSFLIEPTVFYVEILTLL